MIGVGGQINITSCRQFHILGAQELAFADSCTHIAANHIGVHVVGPLVRYVGTSGDDCTVA